MIRAEGDYCLNDDSILALEICRGCKHHATHDRAHATRTQTDSAPPKLPNPHTCTSTKAACTHGHHELPFILATPHADEASGTNEDTMQALSIPARRTRITHATPHTADEAHVKEDTLRAPQHFDRHGNDGPIGKADNRDPALLMEMGSLHHPPFPGARTNTALLNP